MPTYQLPPLDLPPKRLFEKYEENLDTILKNFNEQEAAEEQKVLFSYFEEKRSYFLNNCIEKSNQSSINQLQQFLRMMDSLIFLQNQALIHKNQAPSLYKAGREVWLHGVHMAQHLLHGAYDTPSRYHAASNTIPMILFIDTMNRAAAALKEPSTAKGKALATATQKMLKTSGGVLADLNPEKSTKRDRLLSGLKGALLSLAGLALIAGGVALAIILSPACIGLIPGIPLAGLGLGLLKVGVSELVSAIKRLPSPPPPREYEITELMQSTVATAKAAFNLKLLLGENTSTLFSKKKEEAKAVKVVAQEPAVQLAV